MPSVFCVMVDFGGLRILLSRMSGWRGRAKETRDEDDFDPVCGQLLDVYYRCFVYLSGCW